MSIYKRGNFYWVTFHSKIGGENRRLQMSTETRTKSVAVTFERQLARLHDHALCGTPVPPDLNQFVSRLTEKQLKKLIDFSLVPGAMVSMSLPFNKHLDDFLADCGDQSEDHIKIKRRDIEKAAEAIGATRLKDFTLERLRPYFLSLEDSQSARSRNRIRSCLKVFLDWSVKQGYLHEHRIDHIPRASEQKDRRRARRALTDQELTALLSTAPADRALVYLFIVRTGLRRSEAKHVRWRDIDLDAATLELFAENTKTGKAATLPLPRQLVEHLRVAARQGVAPGQLVFESMPKAPTVKRDLERAGIETRDADGLCVDLHALRTKYATNLLRTGATASAAKHATRHSNTSVLDQHYNRLNLEDTRRIVDQLPEIQFTTEDTSQIDEGLSDVALSLARDPLESTLSSIDWLDEGTKSMLAFIACSLVVNRYTTSSCTDRQQGAPIDIKDVFKSFQERDLRAISSAG